MIIFSKYFFLVSLLIGSLYSFAQIDKVLQPAQITPPNPGMTPQQKEDSDPQLAAKFFRNKEYDKAVVIYEKLYNEKQTHSAYYNYYLFCLIELERFNEAENLVKEQINRSPNRTKYLVDLGFVYTEAGKVKKGEKQYEKALEEMPANKGLIIEMSNAFLYRGKTDFAVEAYKIGSQKINYPFILELGNLYRQTRDYASMIEAYLDYLNLSEMNLPVVKGRLQSVVNDDPKGNISEYLRQSLLQRVQKNPDKVYYSEMLYWLSIQKEDFVMAFMQAKAIDRRLNENGEKLLELANICIENEEYNTAIEAFSYVEKKGDNNILYTDARMGLLYARYLKVVNDSDHNQNDLLKLEEEYISTLDDYGKNSGTILIMQYLGHLQAFFLDKRQPAIELLYEAIEIPRARPEAIAACKIELADILMFEGDVWEAKLLYSQVDKAFKHDPVGFEARFRNAKLSFYLGEYRWAKAQLDVLKAATSKLIANDALKLSVLIAENIDPDSTTYGLDLYGRAELLAYQNKPNEALITLDSIFDLGGYHPIFDDVMLRKAEINIEQNNFEMAAAILMQLIKDYPYDVTADNALFSLAQLYDGPLNDAEKAKKYYQSLLNEYPASVFISEARKRFRILRGDFDKENLTDEEILMFDLEPN